jgi:hypothetical protein
VGESNATLGQPLAYLYNNGGLNNQRCALYGLFVTAMDGPEKRIILPDIFLYDHRDIFLRGQLREVRTAVAIDTVYDLQELDSFAQDHGIRILPSQPQGEAGGWNFFGTGTIDIGVSARDGLMSPDSRACKFARRLVPLCTRTELFARVRDRVFKEIGIGVVAQLRIERDWDFFSKVTLQPTVGSAEDYAPSFSEIMVKICNTISNPVRDIFVVCDEAALMVTKDEIRFVVREQFGIDLYWKSDILTKEEFAALNIIELSIIDFEIATRSGTFVGNTRSCFSNQVTFNRYAHTRAPVTDHYIYNLVGPQLGRRTDNGVCPLAAAATA